MRIMKIQMKIYISADRIKAQPFSQHIINSLSKFRSIVKIEHKLFIALRLWKAHQKSLYFLCFALFIIFFCPFFSLTVQKELLLSVIQLSTNEEQESIWHKLGMSLYYDSIQYFTTLLNMYWIIVFLKFNIKVIKHTNSFYDFQLKLSKISRFLKHCF
jgi:hypothetical protein